MKRSPSLPFQILATLRVAGFVLALTRAFLWFVLGRTQQQIEQSGRENFSLLAHSTFSELDAITQAQIRYLGVLSKLLPNLPNIYDESASRALAQTFLDQPGPNGLTIVNPHDDMLFFLKKDPDAPAGSAYTMSHFSIKPNGVRSIDATYRAADHSVLKRRSYAINLYPNKREWHIGALNSAGPFFSEPHLIPVWNRYAVTLALALRSGNSVVGLVTPVDLLDHLLDQLPISANGTALLLDDQHRIVAFRTEGDRWSDINLSKARMKSVTELGHPVLVEAERATGRLAEDQVSLVTLHDQPFLLAWHSMAKVSGTQYRMLLLSPLGDMSKLAQSARNDAWLVAIMGLAILLPLTWFGTGVMARVLQKLVKDSERIGHLDFTPAEKPIRSNISEVLALGFAHDTMRDALATGTRALARVSKQLERLVGIGVDLAAKKDRQALLDAILHAAREMTDAETVLLFLRDDQDVLRLAATSGMSLPRIMPALDMKVPALQRQSLAIYTMLKGEISIVHDLDSDTREELTHMRLYKNRHPNFRAQTLVSLPLRTPDGAVGVMQVFNARDPDRHQVAPFSAPQITYLQALAAQAAVALENQKLVASQSQLLDSLVRTLGDAVDAKSAYTGRHCARVPELAMMLAAEAHAAESGPLAGFAFRNEDEWREFRTGAWLHDCGKITSPEHVMDKATKLETIYNRLHEIRTRFEVLLRDAFIETLQAQLTGRMDAVTAAQAYAQRAQVLQDDYAFVAACNVGKETMAAADIERLQAISTQTWLRHFDDRLGSSYEEQKRHAESAPAPLPVTEALIANKPWHLIPRPEEQTKALTEGFRMEVPEYLYNHGELYNLCIERGTLTREERFKINEHIIHTIRMLEGAQFPPQLRRVPEYAGTHHETLDGKGYPRGLTAAELSIPARIMAIADIFEALTAADRPYKPAKTLSESIAILHGMKRKGLIDADLFNLFLSSGVHLRFAQRFLSPEQIDITDITPYLNDLNSRAG